MQFLPYITTALVALVSVVSSQTPGACTGVCQGLAHDPSIIRRVSDGTYFRFSTGNKVNVASAPNLSGPWTLQGSAIPAGSKIALDGRNGNPPTSLLFVGLTDKIFGPRISTAPLTVTTISTIPSRPLDPRSVPSEWPVPKP